jgi:peptidoglycan/LPS O-acetylase OafA/YrhL
LIGMAIFALYFIEKPAQRKLRSWMGIERKEAKTREVGKPGTEEAAERKE